MKSLKEQIERKCIHFNGIMNKCCKAGINYDDVKVDRPFKFPCLKQGGECSKSQFPTEADVNKRIQEIEDGGYKAIKAKSDIKDHYAETGEVYGKVKCECGGNINYTISSTNNHVRAKCSNCTLSFME